MRQSIQVFEIVFQLGHFHKGEVTNNSAKSIEKTCQLYTLRVMNNKGKSSYAISKTTLYEYVSFKKSLLVA